MRILACDLGGTLIKLGVVEDGNLLIKRCIPAESEKPLYDKLPVIARALEQLCSEINLSVKEIDGVSISFPGIVDGKNNKILSQHGKYPDAPNLDLEGWFRKHWGLPICLEIDSKMALIGEWQYGVAKNYNDVIMITLGTGIGVASIHQGRFEDGKHFQFGRMGSHITIKMDGKTCHCGNIGCAEAEASTVVLPQMAKEHAKWKNSLLQKEKVIDYEAVFRLAKQGDACALDIRTYSLQVWASLAVSLANVYDPELIVLGGGILKSKDMIIPYIQEQVTKRAFNTWGEVKVLASSLGSNLALYGGEWLLNNKNNINV